MSTTAYKTLPAIPATATRPLSGYTVLDLTRALAGPHAGMMMGDLGARVIKVETPATGGDTRSWGPPSWDPRRTRRPRIFFPATATKESIALDLKSAEGKETLSRLIERSDVLMENFRTGVLERIGLGIDALNELNPRLVILSIAGFGHDGPDDPQRVGIPIADLLSGMYGAYGALAALLERERTGKGQAVRTSLLAAIVGVHAFQGTRATVAGQVPRTQGNHHPSIAPYGLFACRNGKVQISVGSHKLWLAFAEAFGIDGTRAEFATNADRVKHHAALLSEIEAAFAGHEPADLLAKLDAAGIPAGKVRTLDEVYAWDQVASQGLLVDVEHSVLGKITLPGPPLRFFDPATEAETTRTAHTAPPVLDADAHSIRTWLDAETQVGP